MRTIFSLIAVLLITAPLSIADDYPEIDIATLEKAILDGSVTLLDANGTRTWSKRHLPGAIDFQANKAELAKRLPAKKESLIVTYCGGPSCQLYRAAADAAKELGYTNVRHLPAGIVGWIQAGKETKAGSDKSGS